MGCWVSQMWTLSGLVGAFLDLAIAYLMLCASAAAFLAARFLGFFGLPLPCPCNGLFFTAPNRNHCLKHLLVDFPTQTVSTLQLSVKQKFPFSDSSVWANDQNGSSLNYNVKGVIEMECEASCSSVSDTGRSRNVSRRLLNFRNDRSDMKGKRVTNYTRSCELRRGRKGGVDDVNYSSVSSYDPSPFEEVRDGAIPTSAPSINKRGNEVSRGIPLPVDDGDHAQNYEYDEKASTIRGLDHGDFDSIGLNKCPGEDMLINENVTSVEYLKSNPQGDLISNGDETNTIRFLKQALEEEHAAGVALYHELEKERSAAATAAEEAMAMILRLQEEKASIEMEARQYQRILEEKSAYDDEEMNILKEILVRREREKHFLEKEVEAYRQMVHPSNEQLSRDGREQNASQLPFESSIDLNEDPVLILQKLNASIDKKVLMENRGSDDIVSIDEHKCTPGIGNESSVQGSCENATFQKREDLCRLPLRMSTCSSDSTVELQEKEMISIDNNLYILPGDPQEINISENTIPLAGKEQEKNVNFNISQKNIDNGNGTETGSPYDAPPLKQHKEVAHQEFHGSCNLVLENDPHVCDVHVIGNNSNFYNKVNESNGEQFLVTDNPEDDRKTDLPFEAFFTKKAATISDCPSTSSLNTELDIKRSSADVTGGLPPIGPRAKSLLADKRTSMSAVDNERLKINSEIIRLRERLKGVQEGREKLSVSVEHREREKVEIELLEDIARQLRAIRQLTEPGKATRQASLPPPSSKGLSKKRRCRSVSSGLREEAPKL